MSIDEDVRYLDTHRLIPRRFLPGQSSVLESLGLPAEITDQLSEVDAATNDRSLAGARRVPYIGPAELVIGVPEAEVINAPFCHPGPSGARFNDDRRGAWYAGAKIGTSLREVVFHKQQFLRDGRIATSMEFEYADLIADFVGRFSLLDDSERMSCLQPGPIPACYGPGQALASHLLAQGRAGIVYPSVRDQPDGTCIVCFRPAMVAHPRRGSVYALAIQAGTLWDESQMKVLLQP